ncbi:hypothetical protein [Pseudomonas sp. NPDC086251]|jgi:hypothetical protein|uniref:hypothetical protein n=1 Tax=Pseudomonas sp. NPDC086251 TaxID=3364431 RepID=UPI0038328347
MILDFKSLKQGAWVSLSLLTFAMILGLAKTPFFWQVYIFIFIFKLGWFAYLICACERFTFYMASAFVSVLGSFVLMAGSAAYLLAVNSLGLGSVEAVVLGVLPAFCVLLVYFSIAYTKASFDPFEYNGIKVQPRPQKIKNSVATYPLLLLAGATTLAASVFVKSAGIPAGGVAGTLILTLISIWILIKVRHSIRGLRTLRIQEKTMPIPYTFMQIDEIREARSRWWLSRLFKCVASWRKSPGA